MNFVFRLLSVLAPENIGRSRHQREANRITGRHPSKRSRHRGWLRFPRQHSGLGPRILRWSRLRAYIRGGQQESAERGTRQRILPQVPETIPQRSNVIDFPAANKNRSSNSSAQLRGFQYRSANTLPHSLDSLVNVKLHVIVSKCDCDTVNSILAIVDFFRVSVDGHKTCATPMCLLFTIFLFL